MAQATRQTVADPFTDWLKALCAAPPRSRIVSAVIGNHLGQIKRAIICGGDHRLVAKPRPQKRGRGNSPSQRDHPRYRPRRSTGPDTKCPAGPPGPAIGFPPEGTLRPRATASGANWSSGPRADRHQCGRCHASRRHPRARRGRSVRIPTGWRRRALRRQQKIDVRAILPQARQCFRLRPVSANRVLPARGPTALPSKYPAATVLSSWAIASQHSTGGFGGIAFAVGMRSKPIAQLKPRR